MKLSPSPCCQVNMIFRDPRDKYGGRGIGIKVLKLKCPKCGKQWLTTDGRNSKPYQTKKRKDPQEYKIHVSVRMMKWQVDELQSKYGSTQKWVDEKSKEIIRSEAK